MTPQDRQACPVQRTRRFRQKLAALLAVGALQAAQAQTVSTNIQPPAATKPDARTTASSLFVDDSPYALFEGLVRELRNGGFVLYVQHGATLSGTLDKKGSGAWWQDCDRSRKLAPEALPRSIAIGRALANQRIPVGEVLTSEFCRSYDTAVQLGLMAPLRTPLLNDPSARPGMRAAALTAADIRELLSRPINGKSNRLLVGHPLAPDAAGHPSLAHLSESQTAIFKVEGSGRFHHVATLSPEQWQWIGKQSVADAFAPPLTAAPAPAPPLINPAKELKGAILLQALRKGGYNLYMRHAQANVGQDANLQQVPTWWENCSIQRNVSDPGREQARKVGAALRDLAIPVSQVIAAQFCRTRDTAHLMGLGPIEVSADLNHQIGQRPGIDFNGARFRLLAVRPANGTNTLLVSHTHASPRLEERIMGGIQEAEIVVYHPDGNGGAEPVARVPVTEWDNLRSPPAPTKP